MVSWLGSMLLDYGSQYSQLIARRVREANVLCRETLAYAGQKGDGSGAAWLYPEWRAQ